MKHNNPSAQVSIGFIAQDVKELFPALVHVVADSASGKSEYNDLHAVSYTGFGILAIKAIQEQQKIIERLQARIEAMEGKINGVSNAAVKN